MINDECEFPGQPPKGVQVDSSQPTDGNAHDSVDAQQLALSKVLWIDNTVTPSAGPFTWYVRIQSPSSRLRIGISVSIENTYGFDMIPAAPAQLVWELRPYRFNPDTGIWSPLQLVRPTGTALPDSWETDSAARQYIAKVTMSNLDLTATGFPTVGTPKNWTLAAVATWEPNMEMSDDTRARLFERCNIDVSGDRRQTSPSIVG